MRTISLLCCLLFVGKYTSGQSATIDVRAQFEFAKQQYEGMLKTHPDYTQFPQ
jgi:unsaturated chondroitin disaccharide hydrolase